jgi:hypothetical protein
MVQLSSRSQHERPDYLRTAWSNEAAIRADEYIAFERADALGVDDVPAISSSAYDGIRNRHFRLGQSHKN